MSDWREIENYYSPRYGRTYGSYELSVRPFMGRWHWCIKRGGSPVLVGQEYTLEQAQAKADSRLSELP